MKLIGQQILENFKQKHADAKKHMEAWECEANDAHWDTPSAVKNRYPKASILPEDEVVFNIRGNKYRLRVRINYKNYIVLVKNVGTHDEYMKW